MIKKGSDYDNINDLYKKIYFPNKSSFVKYKINFYIHRIKNYFLSVFFELKTIFKSKEQIPTQTVKDYFDFEKTKKENEFYSNEDVNDIRTELISLTSGKYDKRNFAFDIFSSEIYGKIKNPLKHFHEELSKPYPNN
jgi:hypothetical protein